MKVNIYETVEVTDEQRVKLGALLDGKLKPKRQATREEIKAFVWENGESWEKELTNWYRSVFEEAETGTPEAEELAELEAELEDLLGTDDDEDLI